MRSLVVTLMDGEEVIEEKRVSGENDKWMERYKAICEDYANKLMTNDDLNIRVRTVYD